MPPASDNALKSSWVLKERNSTSEQDLARQLNLSPLVAHLLRSRGFQTEESARKFLFPVWSDLPDLSLIPDLEPAIDRFLRAIQKKEKILFYGDYDVDGITGTAQFVSFFREIGHPVSFYLPHREQDGYGLRLEPLKRILQQDRPDLLVTVDNGTNALEEILFLKKNGVDVIVVDHHEAPKSRPPVVALMNPKSPDSRFTEPVASAGLVLLILLAFRSKLRREGVPNLRRFLDLAALGTIADVVPLTGVNRLIVKEGLKEIEASQRPGLLSLMKAAQIKMPVGVRALSFQIIPRLNAAGRLKDPRLALDLLLSTDPVESDAIALSLDQLNRERQAIEEKVLGEAISIIEKDFPNTEGLVVAGEGWHLGVVGIVAARLVERYHKPSLVLSIQGSVAKGSGRTPPGLSLFEALQSITEPVFQFGGHHAACGLTVASKDLPLLVDRFDQAVRRSRRPEMPRSIDAQIHFNEITPALIQELSLLEPHGPANPQPVFFAEPVRMKDCRIVGQDHLKGIADHDGIRFEAIGFNQGNHLPRMQGPCSLLFYPAINRWNDRDLIQLVIKNFLFT